VGIVRQLLPYALRIIMDRRISFIRYLKPRNVRSRLRYLRWARIIERSQWSNQKEIVEYQWARLKLLLNHAYNTIPYYRELLQGIGMTPDDLREWSDYQKIPFLTKEIVRERTKDLISKPTNPSRLKYFTTGGSTGNPLGFYKLIDDEATEQAFMAYQWGLAGYRRHDSRVILRGEPLTNNRMFQRLRFTDDWLFSSYHLTMENIPEYVNQLNLIEPRFFHVYPSSFYIFTQLLSASGLKLSFNPKAILCGSEPIYNYQRVLFEDFYNTRVYSWLGQAEGAILAGECEFSSNYHAWPLYSYTELVNDDGQLITKPGLQGEIIGTTLNNFTYPFIRYKTGDIAVLNGYHCHRCGRNATIISDIQGRVQDTIILADGTAFPIGPAIFGIHDSKWTLINKIQIVQERRGEIIVKVDTANDKREVLSFIEGVLDRRISHVCKYEVIFTKDIERTPQGKHKLLIQKIV